MLVSVIVPCFNSELYLSECLQSITHQTYKNLEIIIVDDGSTDNTRAIVFAINDERIKYYYKDNGGHSSARNYGIEKSSGSIIGFLDSDDYWQPTKIERQLSIIDKYDAVYTDYSTINCHGDTIPTREIVKPLHNDFDIKKELLFRNVILGSGSGVLLKKAISDKIGLFNTELKIGEDWEYWARIAWTGFHFGFIDEKLVVIRQNEISIQHTTSKLKWKTSVDIILKSFLTYPNITKEHSALIYKRLAVNSYYFDGIFNEIFLYTIKSISCKYSFIFDYQLIMLNIKFFPRKFKYLFIK